MRERPGSPGRNAKRRIGVFTVTGHGSLGDQAMTEVIRDWFEQKPEIKLTFLIRRKWTPPQLFTPYSSQRYVLTDLKPLMAAQQFWLQKSYSHLWAIGADTIDGVYDKNHVLRLLNVLSTAAEDGVSSGVFGASISQYAQESVMQSFKQAPRVEFLARDPISAQRFQTGSSRLARLTADLAFLLKPALLAENAQRAKDWIKNQQGAGLRVLAVNSSGHTNAEDYPTKLSHQISTYRRWLEDDPKRAIVFFPHDIRPQPVGDEAIVGALYEALRQDFPERTHLLSAPFDAWDIKALLRETNGVVTGRMHAAIAAFGVGVAPLCVVYQGKFEGLMKHFEIDGLCLESDSLHRGQGLLDALVNYETNLAGLNNHAAKRLPTVMALAERNFEDF
ncbi:MAG: polysaccharide pyruvyl transferase family protein [Pseudomonadota bacterium]